VYTAAVPHTAFQWAVQPQKLPLPFGEPGPLSNTWFLGPNRVTHSNGNSIRSSVFAELTSVTSTSRQKHRPRYSVCSKRPHLAIVAMRRNNNNNNNNNTGGTKTVVARRTSLFARWMFAVFPFRCRRSWVSLWPRQPSACSLGSNSRTCCARSWWRHTAHRTP